MDHGARCSGKPKNQGQSAKRGSVGRGLSYTATSTAPLSYPPTPSATALSSPVPGASV